jgi:hypothetical protein
MFHQSLAGIFEIPPIVELNREERYLYCDPLLYKLMKVLMTNDSLSYMFIFDEFNRKN